MFVNKKSLIALMKLEFFIEESITYNEAFNGAKSIGPTMCPALHCYFPWFQSFENGFRIQTQI